MKIIFSVTIAAFVILILISNTGYALGQLNEKTMKMNSTIVQENKSKTVNGTQNSFTAKGTINTLFYIILNNTLLSPNDEGISISNLSNALNIAAKSIVGGNWTLIVENGKPVRFTVNASSINADGTQYHTHELSNLTSDSDVILRADNTTEIKGKIDVGLNGETAWKGVDTTIIISKGKAITIILDDKDTQNHFKEQLIYGTVKSFVH
jgi:hypothetical protein